MNFYMVEKIGDGKEGNPVRPNIEEGISYVGALTNENLFLIGTLEEVPLLVKIVDIRAFCNDNGFNYSDLMKWSVGD